ncbi:MAG: HAD-IB family phosphatase, partial [Bacillota bacterium]|nr:HAD-IB family phosphatase [Bacillota bacterium]
MEKLAIFDVDFTITKKETLLEFYKFMVKSNVKYLIYLPRILFAGILYGLKILDAEKAKVIFISFINGIKEKDMDELVRKFYKEKLSSIIYEEAYNTIRERKKEGCLIYLISASPEFYLKEFYNLK